MLHAWMAYVATGDDIYKSSFEQNLNWLTYQQWDIFYDDHFYGGGDEGEAVSLQYLNGVGCNFFGETTGQEVGIMEYVLAKRRAALSTPGQR